TTVKRLRRYTSRYSISCPAERPETDDLRSIATEPQHGCALQVRSQAVGCGSDRRGCALAARRCFFAVFYSEGGSPRQREAKRCTRAMELRYKKICYDAHGQTQQRNPITKVVG